MRRVAKEVFNVRTDDAYKQMLEAVKQSPHLAKIKADTSTVELQKISFSILNEVLPSKTFKVSKVEPQRKLDPQMVPVNQARELIGNGFVTSSRDHEVKVYHLEYALDFEGNQSCLDYTVKYAKRELPISFTSGKLLIHYYFQEDPKDIAQDIQQKKNTLVDMLNNNQVEVEEYFSTKRDPLLAFIRHTVENRSAEVRKLNDDTLLF